MEQLMTSTRDMSLSLYLLSSIVALALGAPSKTKAVFDQKQTGEHNIQVHLKDIQIVALLGDDLGDYDYSYDYSDFTVKPSTNITLKPPPLEPQLNTTEPAVTTVATQTGDKQETTTIIANPPDKISVQIIQETSTVATSPQPLAGVRKCHNGYTRDKRGRCRKVRRPGAKLNFDIGQLASNLASRIRQTAPSQIAS